jgi:hypothetical protein
MQQRLLYLIQQSHKPTARNISGVDLILLNEYLFYSIELNVNNNKIDHQAVKFHSNMRFILPN